jgi:hypothetical protein
MTVIVMSRNEPTRLPVLIGWPKADFTLLPARPGIDVQPRLFSERIQFTCTFEGHQIGVDEMKRSALSAARSVGSFRIDNLKLSSAVPTASSKPGKSANMVRCSVYEGGLRSGIAWFLGLL